MAKPSPQLRDTNDIWCCSDNLVWHLVAQSRLSLPDPLPLLPLYSRHTDPHLRKPEPIILCSTRLGRVSCVFLRGATNLCEKLSSPDMSQALIADELIGASRVYISWALFAVTISQGCATYCDLPSL